METEKLFLTIILTIFTAVAFLLFCWFLLMTWRSKNFKKRVRFGEVGMGCKYWDYLGNAHYSTVESYMPHSDKVCIKDELIPQFLKNVEPSILNG